MGRRAGRSNERYAPAAMCLFDIDWQGTQQLSEKARGDIASIFVLPPSIPELERRLHTRALDDKDVIRRRMAKASGELSHWAEYDYVIINDALDRAFAEVQTILAAERMKRDAAAMDFGLRAAAAGEALSRQARCGRQPCRRADRRARLAPG